MRQCAIRRFAHARGRRPEYTYFIFGAAAKSRSAITTEHIQYHFVFVCPRFTLLYQLQVIYIIYIEAFQLFDGFLYIETFSFIGIDSGVFAKFLMPENGNIVRLD